MTHLIDVDSEYEMKERSEIREFADKSELHCDDYLSDCSEGIHLFRTVFRMHLRSRTDKGYDPMTCIPSLLLFDSLDAHVHRFEPDQSNLLYSEYAVVRFDGRVDCISARKARTVSTELSPIDDAAKRDVGKNGIGYDVEARKYHDHVLLIITTKYRRREVTIALPDSIRYTYISLTGEHCTITELTVENTETPVSENDVPRIAPEISYIDVPAGDVPNLQINGWCSAATDGIPVADGLEISFHAMSLPTARLIWHCPYVILFYADNGRFRGENYRELALIRLDGESWDKQGEVDNRYVITKDEPFAGWSDWKQRLRKGIDCTVRFSREGSTVTMTTSNVGISIKNILTVNYDIPEIYVALTGDQTAITNIRLSGVSEK